MQAGNRERLRTCKFHSLLFCVALAENEHSDFVRQSTQNFPGALVSRHESAEEAAYAWVEWARSLSVARAMLERAYGPVDVLPNPLPNGFPPVLDSWPHGTFIVIAFLCR